LQHPFNVIVYKAGLDGPISPSATPRLLVCGRFLLNNAQLVLTADFHYENDCFSDMDSGLSVEAVAIAAAKGCSRTRAFPIHQVNRVHKAFTTGTILISS